MMELQTISMDDLMMVTGGQQAPAQPPQPPQPQHPADYSTSGNPVQQGGQMISNAADAWNGARRAGASWYEALGNATIGFFNLRGGFDRNGNPRP
jgi:hypothetical protein